MSWNSTSLESHLLAGWAKRSVEFLKIIVCELEIESCPIFAYVRLLAGLRKNDHALLL